MIVQGSVYPESIEVKETAGSLTKVLLNRGVIEKQIELENNTGSDVVFEYEQVQVNLVERPNLKEYIESNFNLFFDLGLRNEIKPKEPTVSQRLEAMEEALMQSLGV